MAVSGSLALPRLCRGLGARSTPVAQRGGVPDLEAKHAPGNHSNCSGAGRDRRRRNGRVRAETGGRDQRDPCRSQPGGDPNRDHPAHDSHRPPPARPRRAGDLRSRWPPALRQASRGEHPRKRLSQERRHGRGRCGGDACQRLPRHGGRRRLRERRRGHHSRQRLARRWLHERPVGEHPGCDSSIPRWCGRSCGSGMRGRWTAPFPPRSARPWMQPRSGDRLGRIRAPAGDRLRSTTNRG